jgi:hypothetical protein
MCKKIYVHKEGKSYYVLEHFYKLLKVVKERRRSLKVSNDGAL